MADDLRQLRTESLLTQGRGRVPASYSPANTEKLGCWYSTILVLTQTQGPALTMLNPEPQLDLSRTFLRVHARNGQTDMDIRLIPLPMETGTGG